MQSISKILGHIGAGFGVLVFMGYMVLGPSGFTALMGGDTTQEDDGILSSIFLFLDRHWSYVFGAFVGIIILQVLKVYRAASRGESWLTEK